MGGLYYTGSEQYGNKWSRNSWFQLVGFILMLWGTLIYNGIVDLPYVRDNDSRLDSDLGTDFLRQYSRDLRESPTDFLRQYSRDLMDSPPQTPPTPLSKPMLMD